ncbi:MAG: hypothetical protein GX167_04005 [Firmicutes bacterium]|jgi:hypothetical protein|nr:hypothetical protein [Bacillota bacterium]
MKNNRFPATHMVTPAFRAVCSKHDKRQDPVKGVPNRQEFQRLIELSLRHGIALDIVTRVCNKKSTGLQTGIVREVNPHNGTLTIETPEGCKILAASSICNIYAAE